MVAATFPRISSSYSAASTQDLKASLPQRNTTLSTDFPKEFFLKTTIPNFLSYLLWRTLSQKTPTSSVVFGHDFFTHKIVDAALTLAPELFSTDPTEAGV